MLLETWHHLIGIYEVLCESLYFNIALLLLLGIVGGNLAERVGLPRVTGSILIGMLFGPGGIKLIDKNFLYEIKIVKILALGFIGFNIGMELNRLTLKIKAKNVLFITFFQAFVTFALVFIFVFLIVDEHKLVYALLLGSIATVTTPAPIVACMRSYKTKGSISQLVCPIVAIDDIIGIVIFSLVLPFSIYLAGHTGSISSMEELLLGPLLNIGFSLLIGLALGMTALKILKHYKHADNISIVIVISIAVLFGVSIGEAFETSDILITLVMGMIIANGLEVTLVEKFKKNTDAIVLPLLLVFFTISGADLHFETLGLIGVIGAVYVLVRIIGKMVGTYFAAKIMKEEDKVQRFLGLLLIPQGGVALDMAIIAELRFLQVAQETGLGYYETIGTTVFTVILAGMIVYKLIGEIVVKWGFKMADEITDTHDHVAHVV